MSSVYQFKKIQAVPTANDFIDIVLSKTQRKTPTVIHKNFKISRIRAFYMRKVKFTQESFDEKLTQILTDFPKLDEVHPFYADLLNVLYDRDHYKLALGQIHTAKHLIDQVGRDYVRLLKFGDSLYRCKQLKRAALGRMATIMKRQKETLQYLEQIRQHLGRLPSIDPNTRTLLVCGYPNVGKSSFINKVTRADVEVQPYAFTTKSLFVGHMDYKYLRWQVIDTPGILDHPLEDRNTIEMLSITALAHLRACILYFLDLTEQCGYSLQEQIKLFHSIQPLFTNKPLILVINKIEMKSRKDLTPEEDQLIEEILQNPQLKVDLVELSCHTEIGLMEARNFACDKLLAYRVESKMRHQSASGNILDKIHVAMPMERDEMERPPFIPEEKKHRVKQEGIETTKRLLEKDLERMEGGPGVYNIDLKKKYLLENDDWKHDVMPELLDGHNVADWIDPEIEEKLEALEREEEKLQQELDANEFQDETPIDPELKKLSLSLTEKKQQVILKSRMEKTKQNHTNPVFKVQKKWKVNILGLKNRGLETEALEQRMEEQERVGRKRSRSVVNEAEQIFAINTAKRSRSMMPTEETPLQTSLIQKAKKMKKQEEKHRNLMAKAGESDRKITASLPKHLFAGKRKGQHTSRSR